ncbi:TetR/AcrR family transcriptional regulator [Brevundimonas sp. Root1423]|uniref:TetR/AcrR family transcriptional regulator n=1 Tax=Brevundimonas sp. Root1423 TaxID=1736462 RepID=UPI0006F23F3F|nr:TetR/AcrR family transcriptional regulator [Brevundimonas sp. Root1423]KQY89653.1 TetR family transcriptional regulator [Brevundimonas sp. Root1423]
MPRIAGQIDETKTEAILDAALALFSEKGSLTSMDAIARRAGVSRQTLYNRFPSKVEIGRALAARRSDAISAPLRTGGDPETVLTAMAAGMLEKLLAKTAGSSMRGVALLSPTDPELAGAIYQAGPAEGLRRLSAWLTEQDGKGLLGVPDPDAAAEMFAGMVLGHGHLRGVLGIEHPAFDVESRAAEAARRFLRAFAV